MLQIHFIGSGSRGNATLVCWRETRILIDCGFSGKEIRRRLAALGLDEAAPDAIFLTHEHRDHVIGLPALARSAHPTVYATGPTARKVYFGRQARCARVAIEPGARVRVGEVEVRAFATSHDAAQPVGYVLHFPDGTRFGLATDMGYPNPDALEALAGCEYLGLEANHDPVMLDRGPYPWVLKQRIRSDTGHLANPTTAGMLPDLAGPGLRQLFALHLSETNNTPDHVARALGPALEGVSPDARLTIITQDAPHSFGEAAQLGLFAGALAPSTRRSR